MVKNTRQLQGKIFMVVSPQFPLDKRVKCHCFRDKSKKCAEQLAALVCLKYLGVDDMKERS